MMKNKIIRFFLLINCLLFFVLTVFVLVINIRLPYGEHMIVALRLYSDDEWYFHPALSKFIYDHKDAGNCDVEFLYGETKYSMPQAKLTHLTNVLAKEYDNKLGWANNTDRDFLKRSIKTAASSCDPNYTSYYLTSGGFPPLLNAFVSRQEDIVKILIDAGADPDLKIDRPDGKFHGLTVLDLACKLRDNSEIDEEREKFNHIIGLMENAAKKSGVCPV